MGVVLPAIWAFGSAAMLGWAVAALIPIAIHFWNRRRYQEVPWGAMDFLLAAIRKDSTRLTIEQLLLMFVRMAILAVFALAIADPRLSWSSRSADDSQPERTNYVLVLDTSYSMNYRSRDQSRLELAIAAAQSLVNRSQPGDGYSIVLMANPPQLVTGDFSTDRRAIQRLLNEIETSDSGADLAMTLSLADQVVEGLSRRTTTAARVQVIFLSDLGRTTWDAASNPSCHALFQKLASKSEVSVIDVDESEAANLTVSNLRAARSFIANGEEVLLEAEVRSFSHNETAATLQFKIDGRAVDSRQITVPANGRTHAGTSQRFDVPGDRVVEVTLSADGLVTDNQRWLIVPVRPSLRVLCIEGEPQAGEFVALALNPSRSLESSFQVDLAPETALVERRLEEYDCVFLNNVARVGAREATLLFEYVRGGGGVVVVLGDLVQAEAYNQTLSLRTTDDETHLLPASLGQIVRGDEQFLDPLEYRHPLVAPFKGYERSGLLTVPTWRYFRLEPFSRSPEIALAFRNGDPAVVLGRYERGRTILVATALSTSSSDRTAEGTIPWTGLPTWPSFPPLVHGLAREAAVGREPNRSVAVGTPFEITGVDVRQGLVEVTLPDGSTQRLTATNEEGTPSATFEGTSQRGVYRILGNASAATQFNRKFVVNVDPAEGDLAKTPIDQLPAEIGMFEDAESGSIVLASPKSIPLYRELLVVVIALLVAETFLAGWFSRRGK